MVTIATLGSHSALDVCEGAKAEGFKEPFRGDTPLKCFTPSNPPRQDCVSPRYLRGRLEW